MWIPSKRYYLRIVALSLVLFEPTSVPKAATIFQKPVELGIFPNHLIDIITPNVFELKAMFKAAQRNHHFEGAEWWSIVDSFDPTHQFRQGYNLHEAC